MIKMLTKRLVGTVIVKHGWAVQSFGYQRYLPLGKPTCLIQNLDRWGADEIIVMCIDRYGLETGPDIKLLNNLSKLGLSTTLVYAGGIRNAQDASMVIKSGADRVCLDQVYYDKPDEIEAIACQLGTQAVVLSLPSQIESGKLVSYNYLTKKTHEILPEQLKNILGCVSEVLLIDYQSEGNSGAFNENLVHAFPFDFPLITYGGIWGANKINSLANCNNVTAIAIGNPLNFKESAVNKVKEDLLPNKFRTPFYSKDGINIDYE
jgi:cyclase